MRSLNRICSTRFSRIFYTGLLLVAFTGIQKAWAQAPVITAISPTSAAFGASVTITGTGFDATASNNVVFFGNVRGVVTASTATTVTVTVPAGATYSPVAVLNKTSNTTGYSSALFLPRFYSPKTTIETTDYTAQATIAAGTNAMAGMAVADLDNDGKPELIYSDQTTRHLYIRRNTSSVGTVTMDTEIDIDLSGLSSGTLKRVAVGDLDNDGLLDIVVANANSLSSKFFVLRNTGTLSGFTAAAAVSFATDANPNGIIVADLDADGRLDVIAACNSSNSITVHQNNSSGPGVISFLTKSPVSLGSGPSLLAAGDLNDDGKPEVLVVATSNVLFVFPNTSSGGTISFGTMLTPSLPLSSFGISLADLNDDGKTDIAIACASTSFVSIFRNTSSGGTVSLAVRQDFSSNAQSIDLSFGDLSGDGKPDMLLSNYTSFGSAPTFRVSVFKNTSSGSISFASAVELAADNIPTYNTIVDLDGDGKPDLVSGQSTNHNIVIHRNNTLAPPSISYFSPASAAAGASVTITGNNFDAVPANNKVVIGGVEATVTAASPVSLTVTVPSGVKGTGTIDVLNKISHQYGISTKFFQPAFSPNKTQLHAGDIPLQGTLSISSSTGIYGIDAGDFDGDRKPDLIVASSDPANSSVLILRNTSTTTNIAFANTLSVTVSGLTNVGKQFAIADLDGDGKQDITAAGNASNSFAVLMNTSSGVGAISFSATVETSGLTQTSAAAAGDFDGDGRIDIATASFGSGGGIVVSTNSSTGPGSVSFNPTRLLLPAFNTFFLAVADFDGDGKPDIISANGGATVIYLFRNTTSAPGSPSFAATTITNAFSGPSGFAVGDIDGDGKPDVVITNASSTAATSFVVLRNTSSGAGNINFSQSVISTTAGGNPNFGQDVPALADINGDGKLDVVVSLNYLPTTPADRVERIGVFNNTSSVGTISFSSPYVAQVTGSLFNNVHGKVLAADFSGDGQPDILAALNAYSQVAIFRNELVTSGAPTISSLSASSGTPGLTSINISGSNFNSTAANNVVFFGPVRRTPTSIVGTSQLTVQVPDNAAYGPVTVLNARGTLSSIPAKLFTPAFSPNKTTLAVTDFTSQTGISSTGPLYGLAAADLDNDGKTDIIETNASENSVILRKNSSTSSAISFNAGITLNLYTSSSLSDARYPAAGDLDGDGLPDIVVPMSGSNKVAILGLPANSAGAITNITLTGSFDAGTNPNSAAIGDLDGDGKPEIVVSSNNSTAISILRNTSINLNQPLFDAPVSISVGSSMPYYLALTDLNGDGKLDIVTENSTATLNGSRLILLTNTSTPGTLSFTTTQVATPKNQLWYLATGDIDGDGKPDIIGSQAAFGPNGFALTIWPNTSTISTTSVGTPVTITMTDEQRSLGLADFNGDGKVDILTNISGGLGVSVLPNASTVGNIVFSSAITLTTSQLPHAVLATDLNGDDKPDIVSGNQPLGNGTLNFYLNSLIAPPANQSSNIVVSAITGTSANFSWTTGTGTGNKRALFIKQDNTASTASPVAGTDYTANTVFGTGTQIGSTGWYCVFNGTGNSVAVTGLSPSTSYRAMVTAYNDAGLTNVAQYNTNTATNNPVTLTTRATITAISRTTASATINTGTADFSVTFNAAVTGLTPTNFSLTTSGVTGASVTAVAGSGTTFTVTVNTGSGDGTIRLNLANATGMSAGVTNTLPFNGETYTIDKTPPTLSSVGIASNNSNTSLALTGNVITASFASSEAIATPTVTIAGGAAAITNTGGNNWTASRTMTGADAEGPIAFSINFSDLYNNAGTQVTATTNSSTVVFDKTAPTLTTAGITSTNSNSSKAKDGDDVILSFTASETITTPVVTMAGVVVTATNTGGNNWTATKHMGNPDTEGTITFSIASFNDLTGNAGTAVTATTNSSSVVYDITRPVMTVVAITSNNNSPSLAKPGDLITLNFTASETIVSPAVAIAGHAVAATNTGGNSWTASYTMIATDAIGPVAISIQANDLAGNQSNQVVSTTNSSSVDFRTTPLPISVSIISNNANAAKAKPGDLVTVNISSPAAIIPTITIAGHAVTANNTGGNNWNAVYTMTSSDAEGTVPFVVNYTDLHGNTGTTINENGTFNSSSVVFDKTTPLPASVIMYSNNAYTALAKTGDQVTVFLNATESLLTPVITIAGHTATVTGNGNQWTAKYTLVNTDTEGNIPFTIAYSDLSGNSGTVVSATTDNSKVSFDKTAPSLSAVTIASDNSNTAFALPGNKITLNFTANETIGSPAVTIAGHAAIVTYISGNNWRATYTMASTDAPGTIVFSIAFADLAGNAAANATASSDNSAVNFQLTNPNTPPVFSGSTPVALAVCTNAPAVSINSLLGVTDVNTGQTLTWKLVTPPAHGSATGFPVSATANGNLVTPSNTTYQPATGYAGTDAFTIRVDDGIGFVDIPVSVTVNALPSGTISAAQGTVLCGPTGTVVLTASGGSTYNWFKDGSPIAGTSSQINATQTGVYTATLVSAQSCTAPASGSITLTRLSVPVAQFSFSTTCINTPIVFTNQSQVASSGTVTYEWTDNNGHSSTSTSPTFTYAQLGNFDVKLKVTPQACPAIADSISKTINIVTAVPGVRLPTVDVASNTLTPLQARPVAGVTYNWVPGSFLTNPTIVNPQIFTSAQMDYKIVMTSTTGCITTDTLLVRVQGASGVFVPNVFTPNGDGQNDKLVPTIVASIKTLRFFRVFNRWGKMLFETTQTGQGWDGRFNGELQPLDTYTWVIEGFDANGQLIKKQGSVTLLR